MFTCIPHISAVTVGHWSSLPLKAADVEATKGHKGNSKICVEAFMTLRVLLGTADQLAFFLPGIVSQIGKVFHVQEGETGDHGCYTRILDHMQSRTEGRLMLQQGRQCASAIPAAADSTVSIFDVKTDRQTHSFQSLELWNMTENKRMTIQAHDTIISALAQSRVTGMVCKSRQFG
nr:hypothetical protein [Tanacetum cinerariifolium]